MSNVAATTRRRSPRPRQEPLSGAARAVLLGTVIGFFVVAAVTGGMALAMGAGLAGALAIAAFTGLWGGPGFGGTMGFVLYQSRHQDD